MNSTQEMIKRGYMWLLDMHLLECNRAPASSWQKTGTRRWCYLTATVELAMLFLVSYITYLMCLNQMEVFLGRVPQGFSSIPLFAIEAHFGVALKNHLLAAALATLLPLHRLIYDAWTAVCRDGCVNCSEDPWPPLNRSDYSENRRK